MTKIKTRFAPSPTGSLHIGSLRTALFSYLFAKANGGKFIIRIEDTDKERSKPEFTEDILTNLAKCGIESDEKIFYQSKRKKIYDRYLEVLKQKDMVYEEDGAIKFKLSAFKGRELGFVDGLLGKISTYEPQDFVIVRSDGSYVFHFVVVVDDISSKVTHIIRGQDHLTNTHKHIGLYLALEENIPEYIHIPLILNEDGSKMSKRDGGLVTVKDFLKQGFIHEALVNYVAMLGWNPKNGKEIFSLKELEENFSRDNLNRGQAKFDMRKLTWFNHEWMKKLDPHEYTDRVLKYADEMNIKKPTDTMLLSEMFQCRATTIKQITDNWQFMMDDFTPSTNNDVEWALNQSNGDIGIAIGKLADRLNIKRKDASMLIRKSLTGKEWGPPLHLVMKQKGILV